MIFWFIFIWNTISDIPCENLWGICSR